jgi:hypothetical protein
MLSAAASYLTLLHTFSALAGAEDEPPRVLTLSPEHRDAEVDAVKTRRLVVVFDRDMLITGFSFCGGGPQFPPAAAGKKPRWQDRRICVMEVELEPDHVYELSLNCASGKSFRSAAGVPLSPRSWRFATLPAKLLPPAEQRRQNQRALEALREALEASYSYYDLRGLDWTAIFRKHEPAILASKSPRGWASAVGTMLEPTGDLHLYLRAGEEWSVPTGRRSVDPLHRGPLVRRYLKDVKQATGRVATGRTDDGIGYVMIAGWSAREDVDAVEAALTELRREKALIVDVRPNDGGDELLARRVAQWFVRGTKVYGRHRLRTGKGPRGFGAVQERPLTGNEDAEKRFDGPVAVLIGPYVMSSCESFVQMMEQAPDCTTVGRPTYGSSGRPVPHDLPNGVKIFIPSWQDLLPDGTCREGKGIAPDILVEVDPKQLGERDPILERALEVLRRKIGA